MLIPRRRSTSSAILNSDNLSPNVGGDKIGVIFLYPTFGMPRDIHTDSDSGTPDPPPFPLKRGPVGPIGMPSVAPTVGKPSKKITTVPSFAMGGSPPRGKRTPKTTGASRLIREGGSQSPTLRRGLTGSFAPETENCEPQNWTNRGRACERAPGGSNNSETIACGEDSRAD